MHPILISHREDFEDVIEHLQGALAGLRTGRAHPALVENLQVSAYDTLQPIKSVASITIPDSRTLQIEPWDVSVTKNIEKAIVDSDVGLSPIVDGKIIRLTMPEMNEESRKKLVKVMKEKLEDARVAIRQVRESIRSEVQKKEKDHEITEDDRFKIFDELDDLTKESTGKVDSLGSEKEKAIMTI